MAHIKPLVSFVILFAFTVGETVPYLSPRSDTRPIRHHPEFKSQAPSPQTEPSQPPRKRQDGSPAWRKRNLNTIQKIYDLTVYPANVPILQNGASAVPDGLFNQQATGRVSPVGNFSGFADSIEYFFALAPTPQQELGVAIFDADVIAYTSGCADVAASVVYLRTGKVESKTAKLDTSQPTSTLAQVAFWKFDDSGAVLQYDAWIPNLQAWTKAATSVDFSNVVIQKAVPAELCPQIHKRCTGENQQYSSTLGCIAALEAKPFGSFDEARGDNLTCRTIHLILTQVRPEVHCPHVGPKGGSPPDNYKCVDIDYSVDYFDDAMLFGRPEGDVFTCQGPLPGVD